MNIEKRAFYEYKGKLVEVVEKCITDTEKVGIIYKEANLNTAPLRMTREELFIQEAKEVKTLTWTVK